MAGVVSSEGFDSELTFTLPSTEESESLQDLIDSELAALRIKEAAEAVTSSPEPPAYTQEDFLAAEREHTALLCNGDGPKVIDPEPEPEFKPEVVPEVDVGTLVESPVVSPPQSPGECRRNSPEPEPEPEPESSQEAEPVTVVGPRRDSTSSSATNENDQEVEKSEWEELTHEEVAETMTSTQTHEEVSETITTTTTTTTTTVVTELVTTSQLEEKEIVEEVVEQVVEEDSSVNIGQDWVSSPPLILDLSPADCSSPILVTSDDTPTKPVEPEESSWTTVEEAARDMLDCSVTASDNSFLSEETETIITEKKTKKKKTATGESGEVTTTKVKKTKKSKKSDEKENHISVITNGHENHEAESSTVSTIDEDELSNVCVKELKLTYVSEAAKSYSSQSKPSEEPVLPTVPIRELRRSFGDIHRACEDNDFIQSGIKEKQLKSSFSKFDQLSKKAAFHVRSSDASKAQKTFSQSGPGGEAQGSATCKSCGKTVFAMEQIKAERAVWHKNCFRCKTCNKQLTVDIYSSHEGELYCKPHFKELFQPKAVLEDDEPVRRRKPELIIRESQPVELPPDVVRASDKADLGLEELSALNVKSRFQVFEKHENSEGEPELAPVNVKRSPSILSKLARFQKKGMDIGVTDEALNGFKYEETSSEEEDEDGEEDIEEEKGVIKCRKVRERPVSFTKLDDVKKNWECGQTTRKDELREQKKQEIQHIRSRLFMGKQGKMKELYEQAVAESEGRGSKKDMDLDVVKGEKAKVVREKFEKGETLQDDEDDKNEKQKLDEDMSVFEEGISKKSRSIFLEMDSAISKSSSTILPTPKPIVRDQPKPVTREVLLSRQTSEDIVKASDRVEDVSIETADLSSKFRFFETYKAPEVRKKAFRITPPRDGTDKSETPDSDIYRDPEIIRSNDVLEDEKVILRSQTASKMLSIFRQLEEQKEVLPDGPKPKKCFTPPPDYKEDQSGSSEEESEEGSEEEDEEEDEESEDDTGIIRSSHKIKDEFLEQARNAAKAKALAAKFEHWEPEKQSGNNAITMLESDAPSIDSTKSLCARFESLKTEQPKEKQRPKVNRFVEPSTVMHCSSCENKVYPLEKIEASGKIFHKACFRCTQCNTVLRMDSYTWNNGQLYCMPHFKQLFIAKGNYDEGFGLDQHKRKWEAPHVNGAS